MNNALRTKLSSIHFLTAPRYRTVMLALTLFAFSPQGNLVHATENCELSVRTNKSDAIYTVGEPVMFIIELSPPSNNRIEPVRVNWRTSVDGQPPFHEGEATLLDGKATVTGQLAQPGFLQCEVSLPDGANDTPMKAVAGAAISPTEIAPSLPAPDDFDDYWQAQIALLRSKPFDLSTTPLETTASNSHLKIFDIQADAPGGIHVSGYLAYPKDATEGTLPGILVFHGAGVGGASLPWVEKWASLGMIVVNVNAHGLPNGQSKEFYDKLKQGELKDYSRKPWTNRDEVYFRKMFLRNLCALDILAAQPQWDGRTLITYGTSQGGAQSLSVAALDPRVSFAVAGVPAMCDHSGMTAGRATGWPRSVPVDSEGRPDSDALEAMRYYDMMNFAARIQIPVAMTVGFIDKVCPPTSVYAAYNNLGGPKEIFNDLPTGHANSPEATAYMKQKVIDHIQSRQGSPAR